MAHAVPAHDSHADGSLPVYPPRSAVFGWILFDWAAQPYFTLITTFVFAPYFASRVASDPVAGQSSCIPMLRECFERGGLECAGSGRDPPSLSRKYSQLPHL